MGLFKNPILTRKSISTKSSLFSAKFFNLILFYDFLFSQLNFLKRNHITKLYSSNYNLSNECALYKMLVFLNPKISPKNSRTLTFLFPNIPTLNYEDLSKF
jgi:hypothetical protein